MNDPRQLIGDFRTADFSEGVITNKMHSFYVAFRFLAASRHTSTHSSVVGRTCRPNRCSVRPHIRHSTLAHPFIELVVCAGFIQIMGEAVITSQGCRHEANKMCAEIRPKITDFLGRGAAPIPCTLR